MQVAYSDLNGRQQENYNYQKISGILADYGFVTLRLSDDWQGADFIAQHVDGDTFMKVQLKGRLTFSQKYRGKGLYEAFKNGDHWYLFPHDELLDEVLKCTKIGGTESWMTHGGYSFPYLSRRLEGLLRPFRIYPFPT